MDLENETSAVESVEDNVLATSSLSNHGEHGIGSNGSCSGEIRHNGTDSVDDSDALGIQGQVKEGAGVEEGRKSEQSQPSQSPSPSGGPSPVPKGYGLRKWRRIKREFVKDASPFEDNSKALKRVLSMSGNPNRGTPTMPANMKQNSVAVVDGPLIYGTGHDSRFMVDSAFGPGTDSENSEDQSSRSSTAASAPRQRYDIPATAGYGYGRIKNLSGKSDSSSTQRVQQGKGKMESSKKQRGERIKIEKENSHSSIESDSRSSNFVFTQGARSVSSNGNRNQRPMYYDGENSHDARADYGHENGDELAADASWEGKGEKIQNHSPSLDVDPLVESVVSLQSVQEALESEVRKFQELGRVCNIPIDFIFLDQDFHESSSSEQYDAEKVGQSSISEPELLKLTERVKHLESRLEKAEAVVKEKESRITELENILISGKPEREEPGNTAELEQIFRQKIEGEIEYLTLSRTVQKLRVAAGDQMALFEQQETLADEQLHMLNKLGEAEHKAETLEKKAEKVEKIQGEILGTEEVLKIQGKVHKVTWCFIVQLVLLLLVLSLVLQLSPHRRVAVPT